MSQGGCVIWVSGLPSSGKSTFARALVERLKQRGSMACILDGDEVRVALHPTPGYEPDAREAFYATLTDLALLLAHQDLIVVVAATAGKMAYRAQARERAPRFLEVEVDTALEECQRRDSKGLYAKALAGELRDVPGVDAPYESNTAADIVASGGRDAQALERAVSWFE